MKKGQVDFKLKYDRSIYEDGYFTGDGTSNYDDYMNAKGIVERQAAIVHDLMKDVVTDRSLIEFGCAYGHAANYYAQNGWRVYGSDISSHAVSKAKALYSKPQDDQLLFGTLDILDADEMFSIPKKSYGLAVGTELMEHIPSADVEKVIHRFAGIAEWGVFTICARYTPRPIGDVHQEEAKNDAGHLNHNTMLWWMNKFSQFGDIDYELMIRFGIGAAKVEGVDWEYRTVIVKFK